MKKFIKLYCIDFEHNMVIESSSPTIINTDLIVSILAEKVENRDGLYIYYTRIVLKNCDDIFTYETVDNIYSLMESE